LYVTYCSAAKHRIQAGNPKELYDSHRILSFIRNCETKNYNWAILSAKYGLFFPWETREYYNVTFKTFAYKCRILENDTLLSEIASRKWIAQLIQQIRKNIIEKEIQQIVFFFEQPLQRRKCYVDILHRAADNCRIEHRTFNELNQHLKRLTAEGMGIIRVSERI
jgi:hypothetical protein